MPVGGGGLIAGIGGYVKALLPDVASSASSRSRRTRCTARSSAASACGSTRSGIFADGVAVREVGAHTFAIVQRAVDEVVRVTNDEICAAIKDVFDDTRIVMEPAGALAVAGLKRGSRAQGRAAASGWSAIL